MNDSNRQQKTHKK